MRSKWNLPVYVVYVAFCALVLGFIVSQIGVRAPWSHPYTVTATFVSGDGILTGNEVFMNGTRVGRVEDVRPVDGRAQVQMVIDDAKALPIYQDAQAVVRKKNLLGETYVDIVRGGGGSPQMPTGGTIPVSQTASPVEIDQVLAVLDPQTRERVQLLINGAGDALKNRGADMNDQAQSLRQLTTALNGPAQVLSVRQNQLDDIVLELQRLYDTLARQRDQVRDEFGTWNKVMGQLAAQEQSIGTTVQQGDSLLTNLDGILTGQTANLTATLQELPTTLSNVSDLLTQSNTILGSIAPYRQAVHDVFLHLQSSFQDTDPNTPDPLSPDGKQHLWSVYSVSCNGSPTGQPNDGCSTGGASTSSAPVAPNGIWAAVMEGAP